MQADTVSVQAQGWGRLLAVLGPFDDEDAEAARRLLAGGDGNLAADAPWALLYACFLRALAEALYRPVLGAKTWAWVASGVLGPMISMVRRWLGNDTWELLGGPVPPGTAAEAGGVARERRERVLAALPGALAGAWAEAVRVAGPDPAQWRWGDQHRAIRLHPLSGAGVATELSPDAAPHSVPLGGDADTIQAAGYRWRQGSPFTVTSLSVSRQVVDLGDPGAASFVIPGGASGDPASPHYADQFARWAAHQRIPVPGGREAE
jgi:penicillin amidase